MNRNANRKRKLSHLLTAAIFGLAVLILLPWTAQAWGRGGREPSPERALARLAERLDLTEEQQEQVKQILEERFAERNAMRAAHREEMKALRYETDEELAEILTAEQREELNKLRQERRERACDRRRRSGPWDAERPTED